MRTDTERGKTLFTVIIGLTVILCIVFLLRWMGVFPFASSREQALPQPPRAEKGRIDFTNWPFAKSGAARLDGEWEVYWQQLVEPRQIESSEASAPIPDLFGKVPSTWGSYSLNGERLSNQGYATYRLILRLHPEEAGQLKSLYIPDVATAYKLWVDGKLLAENGLVGQSRESMVPKSYAKVVHFVPAMPQAELVIQVSNFVQRKGGLWESLILGTNEQIEAVHERRMAFQLTIAACLLVMGLYHFLLFVQRRKNKSPLYFGGVCTLIGLRTLVVGETPLVHFFPAIPWEIAVKIEYWGFIAAMPFMIAFVHSLYPNELARWYRTGSIWIGGACALLVLATPARIYTHIMLPYQIFILISFLYILVASILAIIRDREGARLNGFAMLCISLAALNDTLYYNHVVSTGDWFPFGLLAALLIQAHLLSVRFSNSFKQVEQLSGELATLNESLEEKIRERTASLQTAHDELIRLGQSRRRMLSNISHELGNPLTSIQGYVKGMLDEVFSISPMYLQRVFEKTKMLDRIIGDLHDLAKLEARQFRFAFRQTDVSSFFRGLYDKYELDMVKGRIRFEFAEAKALQVGPVAVMNADPARIEQVLVNLLFNARKFTPEGGAIRMEMAFVSSNESNDVLPDRIAVSVSDTGQGIAEKDLSYVFERFYKADNQGHEQGTGLGLAISKEIIECHGGTIEANSVFGHGSTFTFSLPVHWVSGKERKDGEEA